MRRCGPTLGAVGMLLACGLASVPALGQIPETFQNLQVLPRDIGRPEIVATMRGFARALGTRCDHCHVGTDPSDLATFDFASDARPAKLTARVMMKMVEAINREHLPRIGKLPPELLQVACVTCHHGQQRPRTLEAVLREALAEGGADATVARYHELRERYYGSDAFDFGQGTLNALGESLIREGRAAEAVPLLALNVEVHPKADWSWFLLGEARAQSGDREGALAALQKVLELVPDHGRAKRRIEELKQEKAQPQEAPSPP